MLMRAYTTSHMPKLTDNKISATRTLIKSAGGAVSKAKYRIQTLTTSQSGMTPNNSQIREKTIHLRVTTR